MPYPNFHAARMRDPGAFENIVVLKTLPNGVMIYGGRLKGKKTTSEQAYRFPKEKFTAEEARTWLKEHDLKPIMFEKVEEKKDSDDMRFDKAELKAVQMENGFLKAKISIARPGVFKYLYDGQVRNEVKLPDDLFSAFTMDSIKAGIPITDDHPEENGESVFVDSDNYQKFLKGNISNPRIENNEIVGDVLIYDADLIKKILNKEQNEVSIGFMSQLEPENGFYGKDQYNIRQKNIKINHAAMVKHGRAGDTIKIHIDRRQDMSKWTVDGGDASNLLTYRLFDNSGDIQVSPEIHTELMKIKTDGKEKIKEIDNLKKEKADLEKQVETIKTDKAGDIDTAKDSVKEWKKKFDDLQGSIPEIVEKQSVEKFKLIEFAKSVDANMKIDGLSNKEIKLQIIAKGLPYKDGVKIDSLSDDAIEARFDAACELLKVKANTESKPVQGIKIDSNEIQKKRDALLSVYETNQKKEA
jgi:hypothetical protein